MPQVRDIDKGWGRIKRDLKELDFSHTKVGIQRGSNLGDRTLGGMVTIGAVHEFGAPSRNIPQRSFMRSTFDENGPEIKRLQGRLKDAVLLGRMSPERALGTLGEFVTTKIKKKITDLKHPPLKNPTKKRSGGGTPNPLVDTGQLRASITHVEIIR